MWHLMIEFSGGVARVGLIVGFNGLESLCQPK